MLDQLGELTAVGELHILLPEVQFKLDQASKVNQLGAELGDLVTHPAPELPERHAVGGRRARGNQVRYGLGLTEVQLPVEEGTFRELSWPGQPRTCGPAQLDQLLQNVGTTVTANFQGILTRVRSRRTVGRKQHLVNGLPIGIVQYAEVGRTGGSGGGVLTAEVGGEQRQAIRSAEAHDTDGSLPGGGGNGYDGVRHPAGVALGKTMRKVVPLPSSEWATVIRPRW